MTHYVVTVCLSDEDVQKEGIDAALDRAMDPFSENLPVEPYRAYEKTSPSQFWWVESCRRLAANYAELYGLQSGELLYGLQSDELDDPQFDAVSVRERAHQMAIKRITDSKIFEPGTVLAERDIEHAAETILRESKAWRVGWDVSQLLGEMPTWPQVVEQFNHRFDETDGETMFYDEEMDRAYTMSTRNPNGKWDWFVVGGRWQRSLISVPFAPEGSLVRGEPGSFGDNGNPVVDQEKRMYCDGGQVHALDFEFMRAEQARKGLERYDTWTEIVQKHGQPEAWADLCAHAELGDLTWDEARQRYHTHPAIKAARGEFGKSDGIIGFLGSPEEEFGTTREEFEQQQRNAALVGYALLTVGGNWTAPGHMGWFGTSSDGPGERDAFTIQANKYLDALSPDTWIVQVDCHT